MPKGSGEVPSWRCFGGLDLGISSPLMSEIGKRTATESDHDSNLYEEEAMSGRNNGGEANLLVPPKSSMRPPNRRSQWTCFPSQACAFQSP